MAPTSLTKRALVLGGAACVVAGFQAAPHVLAGRFGSIKFTPIDGLPGYRQIAAGQVSSGVDLFAGLDGGVPAPVTVRAQALRGDLSTALFPNDTEAGAVQMASFSDFYCPYCRVMTERLFALDRDGVARITWYETPIFGPASEFAARGAIAASRQGGYETFHQRLMRSSVRANPVYLRQIAEELGFDVERFTRDMNTDETNDRLEHAAALAYLFAFIGTPAFVIGKTVIQGAVSEAVLRQIIEIEANGTA